MAFYDDPRFLLSHLHHSFVTCDESGMCELAMLHEVVTGSYIEDMPPAFDFYAGPLESELLEAGRSLDALSSCGGPMMVGGHRQRSNTAQRLERLKRERQAKARTTVIQWREYTCPVTKAELHELFPCKKVPQLKELPQPKSALSEALELFPAVVRNPFNEYAKFDGRINHSAPSKKILIYLTMLPENERNYPTEVICLSNARVQDLIGLICWMYTNEAKEPNLKPSVSNYCLKIAEETGEVDEDFPSLDGNEFVGKFGFPYLALIELEKKDSSFSVVVHVEDEKAEIEVKSLDLSLREVADLCSHKLNLKNSKAYHIERLDEPGTAVPLDSKLKSFKNLKFRLIFEDNLRDRLHQRSFGTEEYDSHMKIVEAPLYRTFSVCACHKMGNNYDVQLGISGEKVEINPLPSKGVTKFLNRQHRAATYYMDSIASCEILSKKYNPVKCVFKLVIQNGTEFKKLFFETDPQTAQDIVKKVQIVLEMHPSNAHREYQIYREKKLQKKTSLRISKA